MENWVKTLWIIISSDKHFLLEENGNEKLLREYNYCNGFLTYECAEAFLLKDVKKRISSLETSDLGLNFLSVHDDIKTPEHSFKLSYQPKITTFEEDCFFVLEAKIQKVEVYSDETLQMIEPVLF